MGDKADNTRENILAIAEKLVLQRGFSATSIDDVIAAAGISKGGFFYHFSNKTDLARGLIQRYHDQEMEGLGRLWSRADELTEDPVERLLIFVKLYSEMMESLEDNHPGCLMASYTYESQLFDGEINEMMARVISDWRSMTVERITRAFDACPPRLDIEPEDLADAMFSMTRAGSSSDGLCATAACCPG